MSERFIKFIPSSEAMYLVIKQANAFRLLTIIAECARRYEGAPDGLKIGEALIGDWKSYGMTERNYRTAKDVLIRRLHLEIVETCRTRKKVTTGVTTVGTRVKLISSTVYDINSNRHDDRHDDRPTTDRRPTDDEQEQQEEQERKEQQPQTPSSKIESVCVVVPLSLQNFHDESISDKNRLELSSRYSREVIDNAISSIIESDFKPRTNMLKALRAACKDSWKPTKASNNEIDRNKNLAQALEGTHNQYMYVACNKYLEIVRGTKVEVILYEMPHEKFCSEIERLGKINLEKALNIL